MLLLLLLPAAVGSAGAENYAVYGAERYFKLEWQSSTRGGQSLVSGYVVNEFGLPARDVRLRIESLDAAGGVTATTIGYVAGLAPPGSHVPFEVRVPAAASYRVSILSFDWLQHRSELPRDR